MRSVRSFKKNAMLIMSFATLWLASGTIMSVLFTHWLSFPGSVFLRLGVPIGLLGYLLVIYFKRKIRDLKWLLYIVTVLLVLIIAFLLASHLI